jgi:hypothetical protein
MKTVILFVFCMTLSSLSITLEAQQTYSITVNWNDEKCDCDEYTGYVKTIVIDTRTNDTIINTPWTQDNITPHLFIGSASIVWDCNCYYVIGAVYYNDGTICCQGINGELRQGQQLIGGTSIGVVMQ